MSGTAAPTSGRTRRRRDRGQSDVVAIALLFGLVFVGAGVVLLAGGMLVGGLQDESGHELTRDSALITHDRLDQAMSDQAPRELPSETGPMDRHLIEGGTLTVEMFNGTGVTCDQVRADLGALVYESDRGRFIYEGGGLWEETDAGLSVERNPQISYNEDTARISLQVVTAESNGTLRSGTAVPDEELQSQLESDVNDMLVQCPTTGATNLRITVESEYHAAWDQHFRDRVATSSNVTYSYDEDAQTVEATITNATTAHPGRGLRFDDIEAPTVVGPAPTYENHFAVDAEVANDDFEDHDATVQVEIDGAGTWDSSTVTVGTGGSENLTVPSPELHRTVLNGTHGLNYGETHEYTVRLLDENDDVVSASDGRFFLAEPGGGSVSIFGASHAFESGGDEVVVTGTLVNTMPTNATGETVQFEIVDGASMSAPLPEETIDVPGFGGTRGASFAVNVSGWSPGPYEYEIRHLQGGTVSEVEQGTFWISGSPGSGGSMVGDLRVDRIDPSAEYLEVGEDFEVDVGLFNTANTSSAADVSLEIDDPSATLEDDASVSVAPGSDENVTLSIDDGAIDSALDTRQEHDYTVTVETPGGATFQRNGSFVLLESGTDLRVENVSLTRTGDDATIEARLGNHGMDPGADNATLTLYDSNGNALNSTETDEIQLDRAVPWVQPFTFNTSALGGTYEYVVEYGGDTASGTFEVDGIATGGPGVSISGSGNGTVTVLGTEVHDGTRWNPISVTASVGNESGVREHPFENTETSLSVSQYGNATNLNTYDTQDETYEWTWEQGEDATTNVTVGATLWDNPVMFRGSSPECGGYWSGGTYQNVNGHELPQDCAFESADVAVDARAGDNPDNVRVLLDGDRIPLIPPADSAQRTTEEVIEQGAPGSVNRSSGNATLDLEPNEALFLFELTTESATWQDALDNAESGGDADPDYNDAIVLVEFDSTGAGQVVFSVEGGNQLTVSTTSPDVGNDTDESVGSVSTDETEGDAGEPSSPTPQNPDPGEPSEPDEIEVDVGTVVVG